MAEKLTLTWLYPLHRTYKDTLPPRWEEEVQVLFGNSGLPGAVIPAGEDYGQGCRKILDMVHVDPNIGKGRKTPVRIPCTLWMFPLRRQTKYTREKTFKCGYLNFWSMCSQHSPRNHIWLLRLCKMYCQPQYHCWQQVCIYMHRYIYYELISQLFSIVIYSTNLLNRYGIYTHIHKHKRPVNVQKS